MLDLGSRILSFWLLLLPVRNSPGDGVSEYRKYIVEVLWKPTKVKLDIYYLQMKFGTIQSIAGCLQYYTGVSGRVRSFNFDTSSGRQLSNQDYSICLRMERNFCSVQYTSCPDVSGSNRSRSFSLSGNSNTAVMAMVGGKSIETFWWISKLLCLTLLL